MNLARGAARGAAWNLATVLFERAFGFAILGVLLRYIPASTVGLVAIGSAIADLARMITLGGAGEQVQAAPGDAEVEAGAFWSQLLAACLFNIGLLAAAPAIGRLYGEPRLSFVLQSLAFNIVLTCFLVVPAARLQNQFRFRAIGLMALGSTVAGGLAALPFAFAGDGVDALISQRVVGTLFFAVACCWVARWIPPPPPALRVLRHAFRFSLPLMQAALVDYFSITGYVMLIGLRMAVADVGQFRIAQRLVEVLQEVAFAPARKVFLPVFVAVRADKDRRFEATRKMLDVLSVTMFFAAAIAGAVAKPLVLLMFGLRWGQAVPVFAVLTLMAPVTAFYGVINPLLTAAKRTLLVGNFALLNAAIILLTVWLAAPAGLMALAWALAGRGLLSILLFVPALKLGLDRPVGPLLRLLLLPFAALLAARLLSYVVLSQYSGMDLVAQLFVGGATAALGFAAVMLLGAPRRVLAMTAHLHQALLGEKKALLLGSPRP
jgi:O-antigen/teichoic acid export membrane protein